MNHFSILLKTGLSCQIVFNWQFCRFRQTLTAPRFLKKPWEGQHVWKQLVLSSSDISLRIIGIILLNISQKGQIYIFFPKKQFFQWFLKAGIDIWTPQSLTQKYLISLRSVCNSKPRVKKNLPQRFFFFFLQKNWKIYEFGGIVSMKQWNRMNFALILKTNGTSKRRRWHEWWQLTAFLERCDFITFIARTLLSAQSGSSCRRMEKTKNVHINFPFALFHASQIQNCASQANGTQNPFPTVRGENIWDMMVTPKLTKIINL